MANLIIHLNPSLFTAPKSPTLCLSTLLKAIKKNWNKKYRILGRSRFGKVLLKEISHNVKVRSTFRMNIKNSVYTFKIKIFKTW